MPSPESDLLFKILLCRAFITCPTPHLGSYTSILVRPRMEEKGHFVQKNVVTNVEGQWVESWHLCLPLSAAGPVPGPRHGGLGRAPPAAALSCPCWHSPTRRWSSPSRPGPDGRHWRATAHTGRWTLDLQRESQNGNRSETTIDCATIKLLVLEGQVTASPPEGSRQISCFQD